MQSAPSVTYPVGRSRKAAAIGWAILGLGACAVVSFCLQVEGAWWRKAVVVLSWCAALAALRAPAAAGNIALAHWDGQLWSLKPLRGAEVLRAADVAVHLDFQSLVLARFSSEAGAPRWIWLDRAAAPGRWFALRRALYMRAPHDSQEPGAGAALPGEARP